MADRRSKHQNEVLNGLCEIAARQVQWKPELVTRALPFECPRGLSRVEAARYIGVSPGTFDKLVADGAMPAPKEIGARRVYDRTQLDRAFDALGEDCETNDFDED